MTLECSPPVDPRKIYVIGSLRNPRIPEISNALRDIGFNAFDDWFAAGYEADDKWKEYEQARGRCYTDALHGYAAEHVFSFDIHHLNTSSFGLLILPAGKSGHMELAYMIGCGKPGFILLEDGKERWDVMYRFALQSGGGVFASVDTMLIDLETVYREHCANREEF